MGMLLFDFSAARHLREWMPVNDVVMGGLSTGRLDATAAETAVFTGQVSLENNGGFASVRSRPREYDLSGFMGLELRIRGDGQRYKANLRMNLGEDGILYRAVFDTRRDEWQTRRLPFAGFQPTFRGRVARDAPPLDLSRVTSLGLMISDRQAGPFRLEIARIEAYAS